MSRRLSITKGDLEYAAGRLGLSLLHDCGGFRLVRGDCYGGWTNVFPADGTCPTATKSECHIFLLGMLYRDQSTL